MLKCLQLMLPPCPLTFNVDFGRKLIVALGGNPTPIEEHWCWKHFGKVYSNLGQEVEDYFAAAKTGSPAAAAYYMHRYCDSSQEWAEDVIIAAKTGYPGIVAYYMCHYCGSKREWAEGVIAAAKDHTAAYFMWRVCGSSFEWYRSIKKENADD